ncbi:hypothetical protein UFOVP1482_15 [uncultured Caudovirales phage]|uniref:Bacteriophage lambda, GpH, tail tape measure, C-terminal n=1 Tax=uncultured Caudovirales phage TaxID=2100421 RepID=A0A6J5QIF1_9CAUD|nr:hypothetical protein UFOVP1121_16 [uncultured Caudovirales phage]CAB4215300.1 hypothetical protein UFOVP1482_15 [uncultured Caudovirales phage]
MARGAISVQITGEYNNNDVKRAIADLQLLDKQGATTSAGMARMSGFAAGMGAAVGTAAIQAVEAGARMAVQFGVDGVKAFLADEAAAARLAKTMENLGMERATAAVEATIDSLARMTGQADDLLRPAMDRLLRSTNNVALATDMLKLSQDIAAGTGKSLESVVSAISKGYDGSTGALSRLGAGLDKATLKTGDMEVITAKLADTFGGQAAVKAGTFQGQIDRVSVAFGELQESFGKAFMEGVTSGFSDGVDAGDALTQTINDLEPAISDLATALGNLASNTPQIVDFAKGFLNDLAVIRDQVLLLVASLKAAGQAMKGDFAGAAATMEAANAALKKSMDARTEAYTKAFASETGLKTATSATVSAALAAGTAQGSLASQMSGTVGSALALGKAMGATAKATDDGTGSSLGGSAASAAEKIVVLSEKQQAMALRMADSQAALKSTAAELESLTKASEDYANSIAGAIKGTVDLSTAFSAAQKASQDNTLAAGETVVSTTIANFKAQITAAQNFANSLINLSKANGSQALIDEILKVAETQGPGAGEYLANTIALEGLAPELSAQLAALDVFAGDTGKAVSDKFYSQGIATADAMLTGLSAEVQAQQKQLEILGLNIGQPIANKIADEIATAIREGIADGRSAASRARAAAAAATFTAETRAPTVAVSAPSGTSFLGGGMVNVNVPARAKGGPVIGGKPFLVGEKGPELFVPGSNGNIVPNGAGGNSYTINVQAGVGDPRAIGQQIVEYIRRFEQASGPAFVAA